MDLLTKIPEKPITDFQNAEDIASDLIAAAVVSLIELDREESSELINGVRQGALMALKTGYMAQMFYRHEVMMRHNLTLQEIYKLESDECLRVINTIITQNIEAKGKANG